MKLYEKKPSPKKGKKQLKQRKKRQKLVGQGSSERDKNLFIRLQESDEGRALAKLWTDRKFHGKRPLGRITGHLDGYSIYVFRKLQQVAKLEAAVMVNHMQDKNLIPKGEYAKEAMTAVVEVMRLPAHPRDKLAAAKIILEWTLAKPASESTVNVRSAEDFLADVAKDAGIE